MFAMSDFIQQWLVLPLSDNYDEDEFQYELHVHTGFARGSGTKSNVFFRLSGTEADTGSRKMADGVREVTNHLSPGVALMVWLPPA